MSIKDGLTKIGGDFLGGAFYIKEAIQASNPGDVCGIMPETFKNKGGWKAVEEFGKCKKFSEIVVHLTPFDGSHRYPIKQLKPLIKKNVLKMEELAKKYPGTIWMISFFCEHRHKRSNLEPLYREMKPYAPSCVFVNAFISGGEEVPGMISEIHLESSKTLPREPKLEYVVAFDGFGGNKNYPGDFPDANIEKILEKYPRARHVRYWNARCNGKFSPTQSNPGEPNKRKHWPSVEYLKGHRATLLPREGLITWKNNELLKSFADDHGEGGKDNKLMIILPKGGNSVEILDSKGNVIDRPSTMGLPPHTGDPKGPRYYSRKYAYQIGEIAVKNTGSKLVRVKSRDYLTASTDVTLRSGKFK